MTPTVLLFDLDGTLVSTGGAGKQAIDLALADHGAADSTDFSFAGMTDPAIIRRGLVAAGLAPTEPLIEQVLQTYVHRLGQTVAAMPEDRYQVHAGVHAALDRCEATAEMAAGLGTGNVEQGARIKLGRVDLAKRFGFGGFGSDAEDRAVLVGIGAQRGAAQLNRRVSDCRVVVIGDTPKDIAPAQAIGAESFAVATGLVHATTLARHDTTHLFPTLTAIGALATLVGSSPG